MKLIKNKTEFEKEYPYPGYKPKNYPKKYPCFIEWRDIEGGLTGDGWALSVVYIPKRVDFKSFCKGLLAEKVEYDTE